MRSGSIQLYSRFVPPTLDRSRISYPYAASKVFGRQPPPPPLFLFSDLRSASGISWQFAMLVFKQINLHKSSQATMLAGQGMGGQSICMMTEPYTTMGSITGLPSGLTVIYDRKNKNARSPPRAGIMANRSLGITAMEAWCSRDCAVGTMKLHGKQTILVSLYLDIKKPVVSPELDNLMTCLLYTSPSPRDRQKSRMPSSA